MTLSLSDRLKAWRGRAGLNQGQAALVFRVSVQAYQNWEQGRHDPRGDPADEVEAVLSRSEACLEKGGSRV